jgi:hypothetical protein
MSNKIVPMVINNQESEARKLQMTVIANIIVSEFLSNTAVKITPPHFCQVMPFSLSALIVLIALLKSRINAQYCQVPLVAGSYDTLFVPSLGVTVDPNDLSIYICDVLGHLGLGALQWYGG